MTEAGLIAGEINFSPPTLREELMQNVRTICTTLKGTVPLDRDFGINGELLDQSDGAARARLSAEYIRAVREYEPRAEIERVKFLDTAAGELKPVMILKEAEE